MPRCHICLFLALDTCFLINHSGRSELKFDPHWFGMVAVVCLEMASNL